MPRSLTAIIARFSCPGGSPAQRLTLLHCNRRFILARRCPTMHRDSRPGNQQLAVALTPTRRRSPREPARALRCQLQRRAAELQHAKSRNEVPRAGHVGAASPRTCRPGHTHTLAPSNSSAGFKFLCAPGGISIGSGKAWPLRRDSTGIFWYFPRRWGM